MKQNINCGKLEAIIIKHCEENGIVVPVSFKEDFQAHLSELHLSALTPIQALCKKIRGLLADDESLNVKYANFYTEISEPIRLQLLHALGFEEYVTGQMRNLPESLRDSLTLFLETLPAGVTWNAKKLQEFQRDEGPVGKLVFQRVCAVAGKFDVNIVKAVLGDNADECLAKNPYIVERENKKKLKGPRKISRKILTSVEVAKVYLQDFFRDLPVDQPWNARTFRETEKIGKDGPSGLTFLNWLSHNSSSEDDTVEKAIRRILGTGAKKIMRRNPFVPDHEEKITSLKKAKRYLIMFLEGWPENTPWSSNDLIEFIKIGETGPSGRSLHQWIFRNYGEMTKDVIAKILGTGAKQHFGEKPFIPQRNEKNLEVEMTAALNKAVLSMKQELQGHNGTKFKITIALVDEDKKQTVYASEVNFDDIKKILEPFFVHKNRKSTLIIEADFLPPFPFGTGFTKEMQLSTLIQPSHIINKGITTRHKKSITYGQIEDEKARKKALAAPKDAASEILKRYSAQD